MGAQQKKKSSSSNSSNSFHNDDHTWLTLTYDGKSSIYSKFSNYNGRFSPFNLKCAKISALRAQFSLYSASFFMLPPYFWAASIFRARFGPKLSGKKFAEDLRGVGKSSDILNFIYQCIKGAYPIKSLDISLLSKFNQ